MADEEQSVLGGETVTEEAATETVEPTEAPTDPTPASESEMKAWREVLPEEFRNDPILEKYKSQDDAIKALIHAQRALGGRVKVPGEDATDEERREFFAKIGVPEAPDKYRLPEDGIPEGAQKDEELIKELQEEAFEAGIPEKAFARLYRRFMEVSSKRGDAAKESKTEKLKEVEQSLKKEWGEAYDERLSLARKGVVFAGGEDLLEYFKSNGLDTEYPEIIKAFSKVGKQLAGDEIMGSGSRARFAVSPSEALQQIDEIMGDPENTKILNSMAHPKNKVLNDKLNELYKAAYPEK